MNQQKDSVYVKTFGYFDILINGDSMVENVRSKNKIMDMLKYFVTNEGKELAPEIISENIWPQNTYIDIRNTISTYCYRLKKFLAGENRLNYDVSDRINIVNQKGNYKLVISDDCQYDRRMLDEVYSSIQYENDLKNKLVLLDKAMILYAGEFLHEYDSDDWVVLTRNYYYRIFCEINKMRMSILWSQDKYDVIVKESVRLLDIYDIDDVTNLYYLRSLLALDRPIEVVSHYEVLAAKLNSEYGITPDEEIKAVYLQAKSILKSKAFSKDGELSGDKTSSWDDSTFWYVLSELFKDYTERRTKNYSVGIVEMLPNEEDSQSDNKAAYDSLQETMETILRKDDTYACFEPNTIVFILKDAKEEYYPIIIERIGNVFSGLYKKDIKLRIIINPTKPRGDTY